MIREEIIVDNESSIIIIKSNRIDLAVTKEFSYTEDLMPSN